MNYFPLLEGFRLCCIVMHKHGFSTLALELGVSNAFIRTGIALSEVALNLNLRLGLSTQTARLYRF